MQAPPEDGMTNIILLVVVVVLGALYFMRRGNRPKR